MQDVYGVAAFRSRQQVLRFEQMLRMEGVPVRIVSTPRDISMGCGLSVRFPAEDSERVLRLAKAGDTGNLIGVYRAEYDGARLRVMPIR
ncbi:MAG: DUF3343 domain-containing protein [Clostridiales bacterium]|nr:DUF3343 domain-containing protein [Clostridiales bacterium]